ncbi:hypothetical protein [Catenuloplanes japonicus]|uniref:hypothetical protein n=1 Tax=Catenuloplanes japonicus TaxID=33876 RepID=UPI0005243290|nr:hypothetical protein [Catenuloplanes japonicus]
MSDTVSLADVQPGDFLFLDSGDEPARGGFVVEVSPVGDFNCPGDQDHGRPMAWVWLDDGEGPARRRSLWADVTYQVNRKTN